MSSDLLARFGVDKHAKSRALAGLECAGLITVYATGFDAVTGAYDHIDIRGSNGLRLRDKWRDTISTYLGIAIHGFPNLLMPNGPLSGSASTNFPRGIEVGVNWVTDLLEHMLANDLVRVEATARAEER